MIYNELETPDEGLGEETPEESNIEENPKEEDEV